MAKLVRVIKTYPKPYYTISGKWAKQQEFKQEVDEYCKSSAALQSGSLTSGYSIKSAKVIIIGAPGVGKTSLLLRYCQNVFERNYKTTIGVDFEVEKFKILGHQFNLQLWDTAGADRFKGVTTNYFRGAGAVVLAFDLTQPLETLEKTREWLREAMENCFGPFELFLVATKRDAVSETEYYEHCEKVALDYAFEFGAEYWCTSAKTGENVEGLFHRIAVVTFEDAIVKEIDSLQKAEVESKNRIVAQAGKNSLVRLQSHGKGSPKKRACCSR